MLDAEADWEADMAPELMCREHFEWEGKRYLVQVYRDARGHPHCLYMAVTALGPDDYVIHDGASVADVLHRQRTILPLAILSRAMVTDTGASTKAAQLLQAAVRLEKAPSVQADRQGRAAKPSGRPYGRD